MSRSAPGFEVRRIVVAIDTSSEAATALEEAAGLAARLHAELEGVYVQDINLEHLAGLPVGREIRFFNGEGRDFTTDALEADTRAQVFAVRRAVAAAAARARVDHAFRIARGHVDVEVLSAAGKGDLLIIGTGNRFPWGGARLGRTTWAAVQRASRSVLVSKPGARSAGVPLVCYDGSDGSRRALEAGLRIFGIHEGRLVVLVLAADAADAETLCRQVEDRLALLDVVPRFLYGARPLAHEVCRLAGESGAGVLVMAADCAALDGPHRQEVLETIACRVLIVR
ncbi:MAG: universal stress protein [Deltaproteobacteria bacterium]|nr:universal stress protein [Deltaproteobacteria bacterium]